MPAGSGASASDAGCSAVPGLNRVPCGLPCVRRSGMIRNILKHFASLSDAPVVKSALALHNLGPILLPCRNTTIRL